MKTNHGPEGESGAVVAVGLLSGIDVGTLVADGRKVGVHAGLMHPAMRSIRGPIFTNVEIDFFFFPIIDCFNLKNIVVI